MYQEEFRLKNFKFWHPVHREFTDSRVSHVLNLSLIDLFTVSDAILLGEQTQQKLQLMYGKSLKIRRPRNLRVIDVLKILYVTKKRYPAEGFFDQI